MGHEINASKISQILQSLFEHSGQNLLAVRVEQIAQAAVSLIFTILAACWPDKP